MMIRNILAVLVLSLTVAACDSGSTDTPSNTNNPAKTNTPAASTPAPTASAEASSSTALQIKAGDKVKAANGSFSDATVVSVDEKAGKVTIKVAGESKERTIAIADVVKQ